jgi:hypothetical protein
MAEVVHRQPDQGRGVGICAPSQGTISGHETLRSHQPAALYPHRFDRGRGAHSARLPHRISEATRWAASTRSASRSLTEVDLRSIR